MPTQEFSDTHRAKAGRPRGSKTKPKDMSRLINKVISRKERIRILADLARGTTVKKMKKDGTGAIYKDVPNEKALRQLNEYDVGKPIDTTKVDITSDGKPMNVMLIPPIVKPKKEKD